MKLGIRHYDHSPRLTLTIFFVLWKALILCIAALSPGIGYDTSTSILQDISTFTGVGVIPARFDSKWFALVRWDAIYFSQIAKRGHVFEQEWAWGKGLSLTTSYLTKFLLAYRRDEFQLLDYVVVGVLMSHIAHWLSVMLLYSVTKMVVQSNIPDRQSIAFIAAALQILSPAGIFLSAPYSESLFACLNMLGYYLFIHAQISTVNHTIKSCLLKVTAGVVFGYATAVRSNGLLSGIPFLLEALRLLMNITAQPTRSSLWLSCIAELLSTILGGLCIAAGSIIPQFVAYREYCGGSEQQRPWCTRTLPSVFTWVQSHYWNVGFLRYWTLSNIPLFILAMPMLYLLILSGINGCHMSWSKPSAAGYKISFSAQLALPQLVLAMLAITNYHVQVITRLSSGYPFWSIWLASEINSQHTSNALVRTMVIYGLVQAALYASFLPPA